MNVKKIESYLQRDDWDVLSFCKVKGNQRRFFFIISLLFIFSFMSYVVLSCLSIFQKAN